LPFGFKLNALKNVAMLYIRGSGIFIASDTCSSASFGK